MRAPSGCGAVTPDLAQQAGVLPCCQRQHDRKESCSKHVMLAVREGKSCASEKERGSQTIFMFLLARHRGTERPAEFPPVGAENSPHADRQIATDRHYSPEPATHAHAKMSPGSVAVAARSEQM
jgi:hypothetical protein